MAVVPPTESEGENQKMLSFVRLRDVDSHSSLGGLQLGEWIRTFTHPAANCTFELQWKGNCRMY